VHCEAGANNEVESVLDSEVAGTEPSTSVPVLAPASYNNTNVSDDIEPRLAMMNIGVVETRPKRKKEKRKKTSAKEEKRKKDSRGDIPLRKSTRRNRKPTNQN
jgi:hypothetical protein